MVNLWVVLLEIIVTVVVPLLVLYHKSGWPLRHRTTSLILVPLLWYVVYAPIHELSHLLAAYLVGGTVADVRLIPPFWRGEVAGAWISPVGITEGPRLALMSSAPYVLDLVSSAIGLLILKRPYVRGAFLAGFAFMVLCLRPLFDLVCESISFLSGFHGDLYHIGIHAGTATMATLVLASLTMATSAAILVPARLRPEAAQVTKDAYGGPGGLMEGVGKRE